MSDQISALTQRTLRLCVILCFFLLRLISLAAASYFKRKPVSAITTPTAPTSTARIEIVSETGSVYRYSS